MLTRIGSLKFHFLFMFELLPFRILFEILPLLLSTVRIGGPTSIKEPTIANCMTKKEDHHATNGRREIDEEEEQEKGEPIIGYKHSRTRWVEEDEANGRLYNFNATRSREFWPMKNVGRMMSQLQN